MKIISVISVILFGGVTVCGVLVAAGANPIKPENTEAIEDKADAQTDQENLLLSYNLTDEEAKELGGGLDDTGLSLMPENLTFVDVDPSEAATATASPTATVTATATATATATDKNHRACARRPRRRGQNAPKKTYGSWLYGQ